MEKPKIKLWGINLLRNLFLGWFDKYRYTDSDNGDDCTLETVGEEVAGAAGEMVEVLCSTNSKEEIDQKNSRKAKRNMFQRVRSGFNKRSEKILKEWEN